MSGVTNGDGDPIGSWLGMPPAQFYNTSAAGSAGARPPAPDDVDAGPVTPPAGTWWSRTDTSTHGTSQPGQLYEPVSGVDAVGPDADSGSYSRIARHDWQHQKGVW